MVPLIVVAVIIAYVVGRIISISNRFKVLLVKIDEAESGIDVALTKRYDTLTKLMEVVRAYTRYETDTFKEVIRLRSGMSIAEKADAHRQMDELQESIKVVAEGYPELRSSDNYRQLQNSIVDAEDHLQAARRVYNVNVSSFNQAIVVFPGSIIANRNKYTAREFFEAEAGKREDVKIEL